MSPTTNGSSTLLRLSSNGLNNPIRIEMELTSMHTTNHLHVPIATEIVTTRGTMIVGLKGNVFALEGPVSYGGGKFPVYS